MILKIDKQRETYYNYYTDHVWGKASNYHICLDSSQLHIDGTVDVLMKFVEEFENKRED